MRGGWTSGPVGTGGARCPRGEAMSTVERRAAALANQRAAAFIRFQLLGDVEIGHRPFGHQADIVAMRVEPVYIFAPDQRPELVGGEHLERERVGISRHGRRDVAKLEEPRAGDVPGVVLGFFADVKEDELRIL